MKKLDVSAVTTGIGFPVKSGTLVFLQQAFQEIGSAAIIAQIGPLYDPTIVYILYGCVATGTDPGARTFTAGVAFFNGEIFAVDAASFTTTNVAVGTITTTFFSDPTADPVTFTDGIDRNVHQIRKVVLADGVSGSGGTGGGGQPNFDFGNWIDTNGWYESDDTAAIAGIFPTATIVSLSRRWTIKGNTCILTFKLHLTMTAGGSALAVGMNLPIGGAVSKAEYAAGAVSDTAPFGVVFLQRVASAGQLFIDGPVLTDGTTYSIIGQIAYSIV